MSVLVVAPSHILLILLALFTLLRAYTSYTASEQKRRVHTDCSGVITPYTSMIKWLVAGC